MQQSVKAVLRLRQMILDGELAAGQRLSEPMLAERIDVSRTPIRAALAALEHEGLVEAWPSGGYQIRMFSESDIFDAIELRGTLEGLCSRLAAERRAEYAELEAMTRHIERIDDVLSGQRLTEDDLSAYMEANEAFHQCLIGMAHSDLVRQSLARVSALPFASPSAFVLAHAEIPASRDILTVAQHQHRGLLEAIRNGEGSRAEHIAREHARSAKRNLQIVLKHKDAMSRVAGLQLIKRA